MTRSKLGLLTLCFAVLGAMAMSVSAAQASLYTWLVLDTPGGVALEVSGTEKLSVEAESEGIISLLLHLVGLSVTVSCTSVETSGVSLEKEGTLTPGGKAIFKGCTLNISGCTVKSSGQATGTLILEFKGHLLLHEISAGHTELLIEIEPKEISGTFASIRFEGECSLPETNKLGGSIWLKDCEGKAEVHAVKHLVVQGPLTSLSVGSDTKEHLETSIDGSIWLRLASNKEWAGKHNLP